MKDMKSETLYWFFEEEYIELEKNISKLLLTAAECEKEYDIIKTSEWNYPNSDNDYFVVLISNILLNLINQNRYDETKRRKKIYCYRAFNGHTERFLHRIMISQSSYKIDATMKPIYSVSLKERYGKGIFNNFRKLNFIEIAEKLKEMHYEWSLLTHKLNEPKISDIEEKNDSMSELRELRNIRRDEFLAILDAVGNLPEGWQRMGHIFSPAFNPKPHGPRINH